LRRYDEAEAVYRKVIEIDPSNDYASFLLNDLKNSNGSITD
jgi:hypothetical protein